MLGISCGNPTNGLITRAAARPVGCCTSRQATQAWAWYSTSAGVGDPRVAPTRRLAVATDGAGLGSTPLAPTDCLARTAYPARPSRSATEDSSWTTTQPSLLAATATAAAATSAGFWASAVRCEDTVSVTAGYGSAAIACPTGYRPTMRLTGTADGWGARLAAPTAATQPAAS